MSRAKLPTRKWNHFLPWRRWRFLLPATSKPKSPRVGIGSSVAKIPPVEFFAILTAGW